MIERRIRILHVAQAAGGVDRYLRMLLRYLDCDRFENIVVLSQDFRRENYEGLVDAYETVAMHREIGDGDLAALCRIRTLIKEYHPDIVYAHSSKGGALARLAHIGLSGKVIYNPHGWAFTIDTTPHKRHLFAWIERMAAHYCDRIVCISDAVRRAALENHICPESQLYIIMSGIDIAGYEQNAHNNIRRSDLGIPENAFVVGTVGRISRQKAPDIFVRAARRIREMIPTAHFILVGSGTMDEEIQEYVDENNLADCAHITGWVENPLDYANLFDIACLTSRWEGFGLVLPEYMMLGKPIIATDVDAIPELIQDGKNGLLVPPEDDAAVADTVIRLHQDEELRDRLVTNARHSLSRFDIQRVAREHEILFTELIGN